MKRVIIVLLLCAGSVYANSLPNLVTLIVSSSTVPCVNNPNNQCLQVKMQGSNEYEIVDDIENFNYDLGYIYTIQAKRVIKTPPIAINESVYRYVWVKTLSKKEVQYLAAPGETQVTNSGKIIGQTNIVTTSPLDRKWYLRKMKESEGSSFVTDDNIMFIDVNTFNDRLDGYGACNKFAAVVKSDLNTIFSVSKLTTDYSNCGNKKIEDMFYALMQQVDRFEIKDGNLILSRQWNYLLEFTSNPNNKEESGSVIKQTESDPVAVTQPTRYAPVETAAVVDEKDKEIAELKKQLAEQEQKKLYADKLKQQQQEVAKIQQEKDAAKQKEIEELKKKIAENEKEISSASTTVQPIVQPNTIQVLPAKTNVVQNIVQQEEPVKTTKKEAKEIQKAEAEKKVEDLNKVLKVSTSMAPPANVTQLKPKEDDLITIGIFPFKGYNTRFVTELQEQTLQAFSQKSRFTVVDRTNTSIINTEKELQKSEDFLSGYVVDQGKSIGAKYIVVGELQNISTVPQQFKRITDYTTKEYVIDTKYAAFLSFTLNIIETETGRIKSTQHFNLKTTDVGWAGFLSASAGFYDSETSALSVIMNSAAGYIKGWINKEFPVSMKVIRIEESDKKGNPSMILIKGGIDTDLRKGSDLYVVYPEIIVVDGKEYTKPTDIAQVTVEDVEGEFSTCKIKKGGEKIQQLIASGKTLILSIKSYK